MAVRPESKKWREGS